MKFQNLITPIADRGLLMKWHEPNAYLRKKLSTGILNRPFETVAWAIVLALFIIPIAIHSHPEHKFVFVILLFSFVFFSAVLFIWFGSAFYDVRIKNDKITSSGNSSHFKNIESCNVSGERYKDTKFFVLKFTLKKENGFFLFKFRQVSQVVVPENVNLEQVLQILRDKGVKVVEEPLPS